MKKFIRNSFDSIKRNAGKVAAGAAGVAALGLSDASAQVVYGTLDLEDVATHGAAQLLAGATAALPVLGAAVGIGCVIWGLFKIVR